VNKIRKGIVNMPPRRFPSSCPEGNKIYTVLSGDIMYSIAQKFGVKLADLINTNPQISDPNVIYPGDVLCIPLLPSQLTLLCSVLLTPKPQIPSGIIANAIAYIGPTGNDTISIVSNLPAPSASGNFSSYAAHIDYTQSAPLNSTAPEPTYSWANTIDLRSEKIMPGVKLFISAYHNVMSPPPGDLILFEGFFSC
jgi:spore coat assembly protein SafA